jgi:hypothetical protein
MYSITSKNVNTTLTMILVTVVTAMNRNQLTNFNNYILEYIESDSIEINNISILNTTLGHQLKSDNIATRVKLRLQAKKERARMEKPREKSQNSQTQYSDSKSSPGSPSCMNINHKIMARKCFYIYILRIIYNSCIRESQHF